MTEVAIQVGCQVGRIFLGIFSGCSYAVVTRCAIIHDTGMIEHRTLESGCGMTNAAILAGREMGVRFARGKYTIMTGAAVIHDALMIKRCRQKACGLVTLTTIAIGGHVVAGFTYGAHVIMTTGAIAGYARVIKLGAGKRGGIMANRAILRCGNMSHWILACRIGSIVARGAIIHDTVMIEYRLSKTSACFVTQAAVLSSWNMAIVFTDRVSAIVTGIAAGI